MEKFCTSVNQYKNMTNKSMEATADYLMTWY